MKQAEKYTPVDDGLIPTGSLTHVAGTIFDLRKETRLGDVINKVLFNNFITMYSTVHCTIFPMQMKNFRYGEQSINLSFKKKLCRFPVEDTITILLLTQKAFQNSMERCRWLLKFGILSLVVFWKFIAINLVFNFTQATFYLPTDL